MPDNLFDPTTIVAFGIPLLALVFGLVEFVKSLFNLEGKSVTVLSALMGVLVIGGYQLLELLPQYAQYVQILYTTVAFGLAASGFYKFTAARTIKTE